jgi:hypothetical protein
MTETGTDWSPVEDGVRPKTGQLAAGNAYSEVVISGF